MKRTVIFTVILLAALSLSSYAQEIGQPGPKSKGTATALAIGGIVLPIAGPGLGHLYAGQDDPFYDGVMIRAACAGVGLVGIVGLAEDKTYGGLGAQFNSGSSNWDEVYVALIVVSAAAYLTSAIYDIAKTDRSVETYNREHGFASIRLKPYYNPDRKFVGVNICAGF